MPFDDYYSFRRALEDSLKRDIVGPGTDDKNISDPPATRYVAGILYPSDKKGLDPSLDIDTFDEDDKSAPDPPVALANVGRPSSMGLSFAVNSRSTQSITVAISAARYEPHDRPFEQPRESDDNVTGQEVSGQKERPLAARFLGTTSLTTWQRKALANEPISIDISIPVRLARTNIRVRSCSLSTCTQTR